MVRKLIYLHSIGVDNLRLFARLDEPFRKLNGQFSFAGSRTATYDYERSISKFHVLQLSCHLFRKISVWSFQEEIYHQLNH